MLHHVRLRPPTHDYPADEWNVIEKGFHPEFLAQLETMLALGNGALGPTCGYKLFGSRRSRATVRLCPHLAASQIAVCNQSADRPEQRFSKANFPPAPHVVPIT